MRTLQRGATLIEVLVAIVIVVIGLLGLRDPGRRRQTCKQKPGLENPVEAILERQQKRGGSGMEGLAHAVERHSTISLVRHLP